MYSGRIPKTLSKKRNLSTNFTNLLLPFRLGCRLLCLVHASRRLGFHSLDRQCLHLYYRLSPGQGGVFVQQILVSIPDELAVRMRSVITSGNRNRIISAILEKEIRKREQALYEAAVAVENDDAINAEMSDWEVAVDDGIID
jgi:hypothetical protein